VLIKKGPLLVSDKDLRVTKIGRVLLKTKMDELPQLINVLKGDMSLVGPRPELRKYVDRYKEDYKEILKIRPGITDIASLTFRNLGELLKNKENPEDYYIHIIQPEKIKLAKEYLQKMSLWFDVQLIFKTILSIFYPATLINNLVQRLAPYRQVLTIVIQLILLAFANYFAFFLRFDGNIPPHQMTIFLKYLPLLLLIRIIFLYLFGCHKGLWRYTSIQDLLLILYSIIVSSICFFIFINYIFNEPYYHISIYFIDGILSLLFLSGIRLVRRFRIMLNDTTLYNKKRLLIIGAGDEAELFLRELEFKPSFYQVIGLIDDNPQLKGVKIRGVKVLGTRKDLPDIIRRKAPDEILIVIPSASSEFLHEIVVDIKKYEKPVKIMPDLWQILLGKGCLEQIRYVEPEDLLFRSPVVSFKNNSKLFYRNKVIMVTGAGGSIGAELCRQLVKLQPNLLVLFEEHEENLYKIELELQDNANIIPIIGDIKDKKRVEEILQTYKPQIIFHAAAYKHVPLMESNVSEAFKNNVIGTKIVAELADRYEVEKFIFISTDKAVNPVNVMGMTKKIGELIILELSQSSFNTKYCAVRFGNVLESSGSVVPLFREQIRKGGPVTITHPEITRYFMTILEAVHLVLQAAIISQGEEIFVLDMGKPVKVLELAKRMIELYGYVPGKDIEIKFIGLRPGEKLYEELFNKNEQVEKTSHPKIFRGKANYHKIAVLEKIEALRNKNKILKEDLEAILKSVN